MRTVLYTRWYPWWMPWVVTVRGGTRFEKIVLQEASVIIKLRELARSLYHKYWRNEVEAVRLVMACRNCVKRFSITLQGEVELDKMPRYPLCQECEKELPSPSFATLYAFCMLEFRWCELNRIEDLLTREDLKDSITLQLRLGQDKASRLLWVLSPWRIVKCNPYVVLKKVDERIGV